MRQVVAGAAPAATGLAGAARPIIEATRNGRWLRVSAICPRTGEEASVTGPAHAGAALEQMAVARLARQLARQLARKLGR